MEVDMGGGVMKGEGKDGLGQPVGSILKLNDLIQKEDSIHSKYIFKFYLSEIEKKSITRKDCIVFLIKLNS